MKNVKAIGIASCLAVVLSGILISAPAEARHKFRFNNFNNGGFNRGCNNGWNNDNKGWHNGWRNGNGNGWGRRHHRHRRNVGFNQYNPYFNGQNVGAYPGYNQYGYGTNLTGRLTNYLRGF